MYENAIFNFSLKWETAHNESEENILWENRSSCEHLIKDNGMTN